MEDCLQFRLLEVACNDRPPDRWLEDFLAPERIPIERYVALLREVGRPWEITTAPGPPLSKAEHEDTDVLLVEHAEVDTELLDALPGLNAVIVLGRDTARIDLQACRSRSVPVHTTDRRTTAGVADHTLMLLLALARRLLSGARLTPEGVSDQPHPPITPPTSFETGGHPPTVFNWLAFPDIRPLAGRRMAVVGAGEVGRAVLERARAFGMELGYTSRRTRPQLEQQLGARPLALRDVATWADVVSLHVGYHPGLHHLVDRGFLRDLGPDSLLLNTSRGLLVDHAALVDALHDGTVGGAGLDVFPTEPLPYDDPIRAAPNVVLTPHVGGGNRCELVAEVAAVVTAVEEGTAP